MKQETVNKTLTKAEAIEAMKKGHKVTHHYFEISEFIAMRDGWVIDENDYQLNPETFWAYRTSKKWDDGYTIIKEQPQDTSTPKDELDITKGEWEFNEEENTVSKYR